MKKFAIVSIFAILTMVGMPLAAHAGESSATSGLTLHNSKNRSYKKSKRFKKKPKRRCSPRRSRRASRNSYRSQPRYRVAGDNYRRQPQRSFYRRHRNVSNIAIGAGAGAILGAIAGGKRGALVGAGVGAGAGAAYTYVIRPKKKRYRVYRNR